MFHHCSIKAATDEINGRAWLPSSKSRLMSRYSNFTSFSCAIKYFSLDFSQPFEKVKSILSLQAVQNMKHGSVSCLPTSIAEDPTCGHVSLLAQSYIRFGQVIFTGRCYVFLVASQQNGGGEVKNWSSVELFLFTMNFIQYI